MRELTVILIESNLSKGLFGPVQKKKNKKIKGEREIEREKNVCTVIRTTFLILMVLLSHF